MAKRQKKRAQQEAVAKKKKKAAAAAAKKKADSGNGEDKTAGVTTVSPEDEGNGKDKPKPTIVNPDYDAMPDTIEDPASMYRMALLDTQVAALQHKRNYLELHYNLQLQNTQKKMSTDLAAIDAEVKGIKKQYKEQKDYIEEKYGIALKSYNYNDETGVLTKQVPTGTEEE